jgi:hypothetical protein
VSPTLHALAHRVARLRPEWRDPERFFMDKEELAGELRRLADEAARPNRGRRLRRGSPDTRQLYFTLSAPC